FVELAALPLTPSGKVDRRALPSPEAPDDTPERPPGTPLEAKVAKVWQDLLGRPVPGVDRTFFELGGNSLLAMRLVSRLREATGVELPLRAVVERPTVAGMAAAVEESAAGPGGEAGLSGLSPIVPDPENRHRPFPLNDVQQAYWVGRRDLFELGNVSSHFYVELEIDGLDLARFEAALRRVIDRHDMLRAVIADDGSQRVLPEVPPYELPVVDLADAPEEERERRVAEVREELSHQVLPADRWPLFDIRASRLGGDKVRLHVSVDVLITDAWSSQILARDLARYYADPEAELPPLELTFRDYVLGEVELRESALYRRSLDYWTRRLETLPPGPDLPLARRPGSLERPRFTRRDGRLEPGRWRALQERAAAAGLTASGALLAAFAEVLTLWSRSPRFTLDLTLFNRLPRHPQVEEIVGDFTSVTLLEIDGEGETFAERARAVQNRLWEDLDHRYAGGIRVLRELARVRGRSSGALMPVVFTSTLGQRPRSGRPRPTDGGEVRSRVVYSVSQTPQVWLDHQVFEGADGGLGYHWDAVDELFPKHLVDDLLDAYRGLLGDLADGDEAWRRRHLPVPESHREVQRRVNLTERSFPTGLLHAPAEAAMRERPEAVAVVTTQRRLRYRDVDRMSAALARRLVAAGARPNTLVALVMEKGWEQVVGALAVVRAGAAYLPIEASLPVRRRDHLLERGEVEIVLTQPRVALAESWPDGLTVIEVSDGAADEDPGAEAPPPERAKPGDLAYVIFTSGSTGEPKGVAI
ncbi:MAG TPA: condensation domain-containing protein, partial [Thermoanaerobaculia bacterium]